MKPLSHSQIGMLRLIDSHDIKDEHLLYYRDITIWSLLRRRLVIRSLNGIIELSRSGHEILESYQRSKPPELKIPRTELTDRTKRLLKLVQLRKIA